MKNKDLYCLTHLLNNALPVYLTEERLVDLEKWYFSPYKTTRLKLLEELEKERQRNNIKTVASEMAKKKIR